MAMQEKQLGQLRPADTTAASIYSPGATTTTDIMTITVCNNTGGAVTFQLGIDDDGTTYDQSTAMYYDESIPANTTKEINLFLAMNDSSGNLWGQSGTGNALTFTAFGVEIN